MEADHEVGGNIDGAEGAEAEGVRFPMFKPQKDMATYRWQLGLLFANRDEFKEAVSTYSFQTQRGVKFEKCNLKRLGEEQTWQLRSMNLKHTCMQVPRVRIMHSKWLGKEFKKKV
ncbi:hypothetical protein PIB30_047536 [Stylosanthes scabra]|uniref:Uncharacterized protein n=1 Tax=Stylosanthes scabra TaxID=79078 RepID=A0ABU6QG58_9FABA|nr:hypothetical protein [Stylosanthes scabra]